MAPRVLFAFVRYVRTLADDFFSPFLYASHNRTPPVTSVFVYLCQPGIAGWGYQI
jgi:hypothetical protein